LTEVHLYGGSALRHQLRPSVEGLENKALLSHVAASLAPSHFALQHDAKLVENASMTVSLTTNKPTYQPGQVVQMKLTMTNNSDHDETVMLGPSMDGFSITHDGTVIWRSNKGFVPQYIMKRILTPGESITLSAHYTALAPTGDFVVHNQMFPSGPVANFKVMKATT
jgi:hypothetical protein